MGSRTLPNHPKTLLVEARVEVGAVDTSAHGSHSAGRSKMVVQGMPLGFQFSGDCCRVRQICLFVGTLVFMSYTGTTTGPTVRLHRRIATCPMGVTAFHRLGWLAVSRRAPFQDQVNEKTSRVTPPVCAMSSPQCTTTPPIPTTATGPSDHSNGGNAPTTTLVVYTPPVPATTKRKWARGERETETHDLQHEKRSTAEICAPTRI